MTAVLLIIHLLVAAALVAVILMQRSEGGALGIGGGGGGMMSGRGAGNLLTRLTMILGAVFMGNSILFAIIAGVDADNRSVIDRTSGGVETESELPFGVDPLGGDVAPELDAAPATDDAPADDAPAQEPPSEGEPDIPGR